MTDLPTHDDVGVRYEAITGAPTTEKMVLALCLSTDHALSESIHRGVDSTWFASTYERALWAEMERQHGLGMLPDSATVGDAIRRREVGPGLTWTDDHKMFRWIRDLAAVDARPSMLESYVERLARECEHRRLLEACRQGIVLHNDHAPTDEIRQALADGLSSADVRQADAPPTMLAVVSNAAERAIAQARGDAPQNVVPTGIEALDRLFRMRLGEMVLVGARPSMGKTHFVLSIAQGAARAGFGVQIQSVEMGSDAIGDRAFGHHAREGWQESPEICEEATPHALDPWSHNGEALPVTVDSKSTTLSRIVSSMFGAAQRGARVFAIDYLQLVKVVRRDDLRGANREQVVAHISRTLKLAAKDLGALVICAVQLSRALEQRADRRPMMSDLRESGQLEQDADGILFLYREAAYNEAAEDPGEMEVIIGKQRQGERGRTVYVRYIPGDGWVRDPTYLEQFSRAARR